MRRILCAVSVCALVVPGAAAAQQQENRAAPHHQNRPSGQGGHHENRPSGQNRGQQNNAPSGGQHHHRPQGERPSSQPSRPDNRPDQATRPETRPNRPEARPNHPSTLPTYRPGHRPSTYHRVRAPVFHYPHGYHYRRWSTGLILPHIFLSNYYFWNDWALLGLGPPPPGYIWVRYGPDLLLVNRYNGRIADVIYGAFY